jgi:hypothetical protein
MSAALLFACLVCSSTLTMDATRSSEDNTFHTHRRVNLTPRMIADMFEILLHNSMNRFIASQVSF